MSIFRDGKRNGDESNEVSVKEYCKQLRKYERKGWACSSGEEKEHKSRILLLIMDI